MYTSKILVHHSEHDSYVVAFLRIVNVDRMGKKNQKSGGGGQSRVDVFRVASTNSSVKKNKTTAKRKKVSVNIRDNRVLVVLQTGSAT